MGLTSTSMGSNLLDEDIMQMKQKCEYTVAIAGNPNVRKIYNF